MADEMSQEMEHTEMDVTQDTLADASHPIDGGSPAAPAEGRYKCEHCNKSFGRREHYKRHQNIHTGAKPFPCPLCPRAFPRKDTLQRHVLMHGKAGPEALPAKIRLRTSRACWPCAKSKMRCDGEEPCGRCQSRGVRCGRRPTSAGSDDVEALMQSSGAMFGESDASHEQGTTLSHLLTGAGAENWETPRWTASNGGAPLSGRQPPSRRQELDIMAAENSKLVPELQLATYVKMRQFWDSVGASLPRISSIPSAEAMNVFVQLYFQHFHQQFPLLHLPTFQPREDLWLLVLAVAAIGAEFSDLNSQELMDWFEQVAKKAISHIIANEATRANTSVCQATLLFSMLLFASGSDDLLMFLKYHASLLATLCRNLIARRIADDSHTDGPEVYLMRWSYFIDIEQERRFLAFTWIFECRRYLVTGVPPVLAAQEFTRTLPCDEQFWFCTSEEEWQDRYQKAAPKKHSLAAVVGQPLSAEIVGELGDSALMTMFLTLLVERKRAKEAVSIWFRTRLESATEDEALHEAGDADMEFIVQEVKSRYEKAGEGDLGRLRSFFYASVILRLVSLDDLRHAAGIAAPSGMSAKAKKGIPQVFKSHPLASRTALVYAAELFSELRSAKIISRYDVRTLTIAILYISSWALLNPGGKRQTRDGSDISTSSVRIDEGIRSASVQEWVGGKTGLRAHIDGIGIVDGPQASTGALDGAARMLQAKAPTSLRAKYMTSNLIAAANGREE